MDFETWCKENTNIAELAKKFQSSKPEQYLCFYFSKIFDDIICQARFEWLPNSHLDIYIPSLNFAIEYDGSYYHSDRQDEDLNKTSLCKDHEIQVVRICEQEKRQGYENLSKCKDVVIYFPNKEYRNIKTAIDDLKLLINEKFNLFVSVNVDLDRDEKEILRYVQNKYHQKTIAHIWPEVKDYWNEKKKDYFDVFCVGSKKEYELRCPHCKSTFKLRMRYAYSGKALPPCNNDNCESTKIEHQIENAIMEYNEIGKTIVFDNSLNSRRLYDRIILHIRRPSYRVSEKEIELYEKSGINIQEFENH